MSKDKLIVFDKIKKGKPKKNPKTLTDQLTILWAKVQKLKNRNNRITSDLVNMKSAYQEYVEKEHKQRFQELYKLIEQLLFLEKDAKLSSKQRQVFQAIINQLMVDALQSPFIDTMGFRDLIPEYKSAHEKKSKKKTKTQQKNERKQEVLNYLQYKSNHLENIESYFSEEQWLEMLSNDEKVKKYFDQIIAPILYQKQLKKAIHKANNAHNSKEKHNIDNQTNTLEIKHTSVNSLYKQLAKKLHPDKTQDVHEKDKFHDLMIVISTAKKENDLITLLNLYTEYFKEENVKFNESEAEHLYQILKNQLSKLEEEKANLLSSPMDEYIYKIFAGVSGRGITKKAYSMANDEKVIFQQYQHLLNELPDELSLKNYLQNYI
ncbi:hypothetical protein [Flammeovirga sp. SubArs3]|uniref:hypothetical protein n=1 Tax=Flammeovirga sp. SubArs3 TaxID=2995316 RepID=UPI00248BD2BF|nr:hypothetical protein [Flammeovirga sp. SubArs3]